MHDYSDERRISHITLDETTIIWRSADIEQERRIAIFDLLEGNFFAPLRPQPDGYVGPYRVGLSVQEGRLAIEITREDGTALETHILGMGRFRRPIRDYFAICDSYFQAVKQSTPQQIETIDMARRGVHNEAAELLKTALEGKVDLDFDTARRLFTLICVLHIKGMMDASDAPADLIAAARDAATRAYAPYSNFHVGAAIRLTDGRIVTGANVENASYGLSLCAETVAIAKIANEGLLTEVIEVAVIGGTGAAAVSPCGRCRQMLNEAAQLGKRDFTVHCVSGDGHAVESHALSYLLPNAFGPADLT